MKNRYFSILTLHFLFLLLTSISSVYAQTRHLQFMQLTPDNGLSSSVISAILQDQRGFVWIGTTNGLNRYDGFNFVVYKNIPADSASLVDNVVQTIFEDRDKRLFIGTEHGLCLYDREKDRFLNYLYDKSSPMRGIDFGVSKIAEDSAGNLWLATNIGLIYFDRNKNQIIQFTHDPDNPESLSSNNVEEVFIDKFNRLWITTRSGLNIFLPEKGTFKHFAGDKNFSEDLSNKIFLNIAEDKEGNLWLGSTEGLYCLKNGPEEQIKGLIHYKYDSKDKSSLSIDQISSLYVDDIGNLWIGTENGGLNLFDKKYNRFWHYRKDDYDPESLNNESIEAIYQDKAGNLWLGTFTGGLNIAVKSREAILKFQTLPGAPFSLSHNTVTCFLEDHNSQTWVGTDGGGLNLFDMQINHFSHFNTENSGLNSNSILCLLEDSGNRMWLGTWAGGLVNFDVKTKTFTTFTTRNSGIQDNNIYAVAEGYDNDLWLGSFEHGLIHYQIKEKKFTDYTIENSGLRNEMIVKIVKFSEGRVLIGTTGNFQIFYPSDNRFITFTSSKDNENSLSYSRVTDILAESDTCIWIGTPDGLNRFNPVTGSFKRYYEKDGLLNNFIKGLILDKSGALWVTTNGGACRFDYRKTTFKCFTRADGLQSNEFSERSILNTKSGALLMGGTKGFNIVYPGKIAENKSIPDIQITDLKIFYKSVKPGVENSPLIKNITETKSLILSHDLTVLTFSFAAMDFSAPEKNKYAYMMGNFDRDWIYTNNKGEATYTNLNPGEYVFSVKGSNNDGLWNEKGTSIRITILPPWWSSWWFRLVMISAVILVFTSVYLLRVQQLKNQKILLENTVALKTAELKELNASKDKFFSIIAHDLKNPFNTIIGFSEILKDELDSGNSSKIKEYTGMINISAVQTYRLLENLLEWANSQRGKISFNPVSINLTELVKEEFIILEDMAKGKNIELNRYVSDKLTVVADRNMLKTILRNLISNAIKFTHRNGKVEVKAAIANNEVEIAVSDSGIGMSEEALAKLFRIDANISSRGTENERGTGLGLFLCKEFIEKHGGKILVKSEPGKGSVFTFILPLDVNASV